MCWIETNEMNKKSFCTITPAPMITDTVPQLLLALQWVYIINLCTIG